MQHSVCPLSEHSRVAPFLAATIHGIFLNSFDIVTLLRCPPPQQVLIVSLRPCSLSYNAQKLTKHEAAVGKYNLHNSFFATLITKVKIQI